MNEPQTEPPEVEVASALAPTYRLTMDEARARYVDPEPASKKKPRVGAAFVCAEDGLAP